MGGSLSILNKSKVHVVVTLKHGGLEHCRDTIQPGGRHDYDLALFSYDIYVEGADQQTLHEKLPRGAAARVAHNVSVHDVHGMVPAYRVVKPVKLANISATKSGGHTKVFYISETVDVSGECQLGISMTEPPEEQWISPLQQELPPYPPAANPQQQQQ